MGSGGRADTRADQRCPDRRRRAGVLHRRGHCCREGRIRAAVPLAGQFRRSLCEVERGAAGLAPVRRRLLSLASIFAVDPGGHRLGAAFAERQHALPDGRRRHDLHGLSAKLPRSGGPCVRLRFTYRRRSSRRAVGRRRASSSDRGSDRRGAVLASLPGRPSPEAETAIAAFERFQHNLHDALARSTSGKELVARGFARDVELAAEYAVSATAPVMQEDRFVDAAAPTIAASPSSSFLKPKEPA